jgi:two-component system sensor histidine kinase KdpD
LLEAAALHVRETFDASVAILVPDLHASTGANTSLRLALADAGTMRDDEKDLGVAEWVWRHQKPAGMGTDTLPMSKGLFLPLRGARGRVGVLAIFASTFASASTSRAPLRADDPDERQLLETIAGLVGQALERADLADEAHRASLRVDAEQLRNALLSSVSHDLRTPLGVITGATSALLQKNPPKDEATQEQLLRTAHAEAIRLTQLVHNLLEMTRLEAGAMKVQKELQSIEDVVGAALDRLEDRLADREVETSIPTDLPLVPFDAVLIEQVFLNLLENAVKYAPPKSALRVAARLVDRELECEVADRGPGVRAEDKERIFDKFYRVREGEGGGAGLGLTICRGIVSAHGGKIWVDERQGGGAAFRFTLPLADAKHAEPS